MPEAPAEVTRASSAGCATERPLRQRFSEGKLGEYASDNLYVKINGRAGFFQSFGVKSAAHGHPGGGIGGHARSVDIELYDLGESRNAIGAYNGERPPGIDSDAEPRQHVPISIATPAFLARGRVLCALHRLRRVGWRCSRGAASARAVSARACPGRSCPGAFSLFVDQLKLDAIARDATSRTTRSRFGFAQRRLQGVAQPGGLARKIWRCLWSRAEMRRPAAALAATYLDGFASLGSRCRQDQLGSCRCSRTNFWRLLDGAGHRTLGGRRSGRARGRSQTLEQLLERLVMRGAPALPAEVKARALPSVA